MATPGNELEYDVTSPLLWPYVLGLGALGVDVDSLVSLDELEFVA